MLQRQYVPAIKRLGTRSSGRQNVDTEKSKNRVKKCSNPTQQRNHCKLNFISATRFSIIHCFYNKVTGGTNCFVIGDPLVLYNR